VPRFQPRVVIDTLNRNGVRYVLIGGVAATLHGSSLRTGDTGVCPDRRSDNLDNLANALDVTFTPSGTNGYDDLVAHAATFDLDGVAAPTAALLDIIRSKTAANRPKDQASLPVLEELARKLGLLT